MNTLSNKLWFTLVAAPSLFAVACCVVLVQQGRRNRAALDTLTMRIALVETVQWRAANPLPANTIQVKTNTWNALVEAFSKLSNSGTIILPPGDFTAPPLQHHSNTIAVTNTNYTVLESEPR